MLAVRFNAFLDPVSLVVIIFRFVNLLEGSGITSGSESYILTRSLTIVKVAGVNILSGFFFDLCRLKRGRLLEEIPMAEKRK